MMIDDVTYEHRQANFMEAKAAGFKLLSLLHGGLKQEGTDISIDIGAMAKNLGSPEMQSVENFVMKFCTVVAEGKTVLLNNEATINIHFNAYRSHYIKMMIDGLKFHFADFLPAGLVSVLNTKAA
jgi:hypothetical protein